MKKIILSSMLLMIMMASKAQNANNIIVDDTRDDNNLPAYYQRQAKFEFKRRDVLGLPGLGYSGLLTFAPWGDASGNKNHQLNFNDDGIFYRAGAHGSGWGSWNQLLHSGNTPLPLHQWQNYIGNNVNASLDNMPANTTVFSYYNGFGGSNTNAPVSGAVVHLSGIGNGTYGMQLQTSYATGEFYIRTKNDDIPKWTSWRRVLSEDANGKVGIGTTNPQELLQLGNAPNASNYKISIPGVYNFENIRLGQYGNGAGGLEFVNHSGVNASYGIRMLVDIDQVKGLQFQYAQPQTEYNALSYSTGMFMDINGKVGINTTTPSEQLSVNGNIRTRKVIVTQTGWPDYVFDSSYQLPSLDSVSSFIQANKHLPDMPSAATIEKDGHDVGEVQKQLLKKVEELTLYALKQEAMIKEQGTKIEILEKKLTNISK